MTRCRLFLPVLQGGSEMTCSAAKGYNVAPPPLNVLSIFTGVYGLDLGVELAVPGSRTVCAVEGEAFAVALLVARMRSGAIPEFPIWSDAATFDGAPWRGVVDTVVAGCPCQPYSLAGRRTGNSDDRAWGDGTGPVPSLLRIIGECQPALVFLENVPSWVRGRYFRSVGEELCRIGYEVGEPLFLRASDVGAPHRRERVFVLAVRGGRAGAVAEARNRDLCEPPAAGSNGAAASPGGAGEPLANGQSSQRRAGRKRRTPSGASRPQPGDGGGVVGDAECDGRYEGSGLLQPGSGQPEPARNGSPVGDFSRQGWQGRQGQRRDDGAQRSAAERSGGDGVGDAVRNGSSAGQRNARGEQESSEGPAENPELRCGDLLFPPRPNDREAWQAILRDNPLLAPALSQLDLAALEAMAQGTRPGRSDKAAAAQPRVRSVADGLSALVGEYRVDQLRGYGNACVAIQAAVAFRVLWSRLKGTSS